MYVCAESRARRGEARRGEASQNRTGTEASDKQRTLVVLLQAETLKVGVDIGAETSLEAVAVEAEQALEAVHVVGRRILKRNRLEVLVDAVVEVVTQKVRPEAEQRVHLGRLTDAISLTLCDDEEHQEAPMV